MDEKTSKKKKLAMSPEISTYSDNEEKVHHSKLPQYMAIISANLGTIAAGMAIGWISSAGEDGVNLLYDFNIDANDFSWISSTCNVGAAAVFIPIGVLINQIGRRGAMLMLAIPFTIGWACVIWPNSIGTLIFGRFLIGFGGGAFSIIVPMYTAEIADNEIRGKLGSYFEILYSTGTMIAYTLGWLRNMFVQSLISAAVPIIFFAAFFFMPETPTYNLTKGNAEAARAALIWLRGSHYDVESELAEKQNAQDQAKDKEVSFFVAIKSRAVVMGLFISYGLIFFKTLSGVVVITYYGKDILDNNSGVDADWSMTIVGTIQVIAISVFSSFVDNWGRRPLLMMSGATMSLPTLSLGVYFYLEKNGTSMDEYRWFPLLCICIFNIFISCGFYLIPWMMVGELFSPRIKGIAGTSVGIFNSLMIFVVTKFYYQLKNQIGTYGVFWIFSAMCVLSIVFTYFVVLETKNKSLERIQIELSGKSIHDEGRKYKLIPSSTRMDTTKL